METLREFESDYREKAGQYEFTTIDGTPVTALALPTWEEFEAALKELPPPSGYIVSPELITSQWPLSETRSHLDQIQDRVDTVQKLSTHHPDAMILLGTPSIEEESILRISLAAITNGEVKGYIDKRGRLMGQEGLFFSTEPRMQASLLSLGHTALICSDIIMANGAQRKDKNRWLSPATETLLVSSCWAVPHGDGPLAPPLSDERFRPPLEGTVAGLFKNYPHLREIIMVDRTGESTIAGPYTAHFKRAGV